MNSFKKIKKILAVTVIFLSPIVGVIFGQHYMRIMPEKLLNSSWSYSMSLVFIPACIISLILYLFFLTRYGPENRTIFIKPLILAILISILVSPITVGLFSLIGYYFIYCQLGKC